MPKRKSETQERVVVYIVGETPMVEEFAQECASSGYTVVVDWNESPSQKLVLGELIKKSRTVPRGASLGIELTNTNLEAKRTNLEKLDSALSAERAILSSSVTVTATEQAAWIGGRHRLVGMSALPTLLKRPLVEIAPTVFSPKETLEVVSRFFQSIQKEIEIVQDRVGMVLPRILCQLINESGFALTEEIAEPMDIDTAMKLGANYPYGPIEWAERIGLRQVVSVIDALQRDLKEERYRLSPLLAQMAKTGEYWRKSQAEDK